jgi:serine phosphatase RsbU (regulator of sigma subunit)
MQDEIELLRRRDDALQFYMRRLDEELKLAARVQQDFLPKSLPKVGPLRFHTLFRPAGSRQRRSV